MLETHHTYIGDGVYVCLDNGDLRLTTGHHNREKADNVIILEASVWQNLLMWVGARFKEAEELERNEPDGSGELQPEDDWGGPEEIK